MPKYCGNCGNTIDENAYICVHCGVKLQNEGTSQVNDKGGFLWGLLGFLIPLLGLILYLTWKDSKPKCAKAIGKGALISVIVGIMIYVLVMILLGIMFWFI